MRTSSSGADGAPRISRRRFLLGLTATAVAGGVAARMPIARSAADPLTDPSTDPPAGSGSTENGGTENGSSGSSDDDGSSADSGVPDPSPPAAPKVTVPDDGTVVPNPDEPDVSDPGTDAPPRREGERGGFRTKGRDFRAVTFPVLGPVEYGDSFGDCRDVNCSRLHEGCDILGVRLQPLVAAADGVVTKLIYEGKNPGNGIQLVDAEGWMYCYYHCNNDTPGSDNGRDPANWRFARDVQVGRRVLAGQVIGYMGDSGNAEGSVVHLHFEIRRPDHTATNPYDSLRYAQARTSCWGSSVTVLPPAGPDDSWVEVRTMTGDGRFRLSNGGGLVLEGDATTIGQPSRDAEPCVPRRTAAVLRRGPR